jgi:hypothetical protein
MPIEVRHDGPITDAALLQAQAAAVQQAQQQRLRDIELDQFNRQLAERARQFDTGVGMRLRGQDLDQQARRENMAWQDARDFNRAQQQFALQDQQQQAALFGDVLNQQQALEMQDHQAQLQWGMKSGVSLDQEASETLKAAKQMQLAPEGQVVLGQLAGKLRKINQGRSHLRPDAYAYAVGKWMEDFEAAGLDAYEVKEPTPEETVQRQILTMQGTPVPLDGSFTGWGLLRQPARNGGESTYKPYFFTDPENPVVTRDGVRGTIKSGSGDFVPFKETTPAADPVKVREEQKAAKKKAYDDAEKRLLERAKLTTPANAEGHVIITPPQPEQILREMQEYDARIEGTLDGASPDVAGGTPLGVMAALGGAGVGALGAAAMGTMDLPVVAHPSMASQLPSGTRFRTPDGRVLMVP